MGYKLTIINHTKTQATISLHNSFTKYITKYEVQYGTPMLNL